MGTVYSYDYVGEAASKTSGTSEEESRFHITATADFEAVSTCELVLRVSYTIKYCILFIYPNMYKRFLAETSLP